MLSYLTLVNKVLRRLRESPVSSVTQTPYSTLVGQFVNDAKREVEDSWQWGVLIKPFTIQTVANSSDIIAWPNTISPRARLVVDPTSNSSVMGITGGGVSRMDVTNVNTFLMERLAADLVPVYGHPTSVSMVRNPAVLDIEDRNPFAWQVYPYPDDVYDITTYVVDPQPDLVNNSDILLVPAAPVEMRAYLYLLYERGEEVGELITKTEAKAEKALGDAVMIDQIQNWPHLEFHT